MDTLEPIATPQPQGLSLAARAFVGTVILLGAAVIAYSAGQLLGQPVSKLWVVLLALTAVTGLATLRIPGMPISFSISDTFTIIAALVVGPAAGALTAALDGLVLSFRMSTNRRSMPRVMFNMAFPAVATWVSAEFFFALAGPQPLAAGPAGAFTLLVLLTVFGVVDFAMTTGAVALAVALERRTSVHDVWKTHFVGLWVTYFGGIYAAMLMMVMERVSTLEILILIGPLPVIVYVAFRHAEARAHDEIHHLGKMNKVYVAAIEALAHAIDTKDQVTHDHIRRVQTRSVRLAGALGITDPLVLEAIKAASLLHDVGKIGVPEHILNKPGRLSASEFAIMKKHAPAGADILSVIGFPYPVVPIVRHHHENWDGSGYPDGLRGEQIPVGARILQVVDCFDALTSDRPYRTRLSDHEALQILADRKGTMYDARIVDVFTAQHTAERRDTTLPAYAPAPPAVAARAEDPHDAAGDTGALHAFFELGRVLGRAHSAREVGEALWHHLAASLPAHAFVLYVYDPHSDALMAGYCSGTGLVDAGTRVPVGERLSGWVAATGRVILNSDARLDLQDRAPDDVVLKSALAVPVSNGGRVIAVLAFYAAGAEAFNETHQRIAEAAATVVAVTQIEATVLARLEPAA